MTTRTPGATTHVAEGYQRGGKEPRFLKKGEQPDPEWPVVIFTNTAMEEQLDETKPDWRSRNWLIIKNTAGTREAALAARAVAAERGTPLPDGGSTDK